MKRGWLVWMLLSACWLRAQPASAPELVVDVNAQSDAVASRGWPLLIRALLISSDGGLVNLGLTSGVWTQALHLAITDQAGVSRNWPAQLVQPSSSAASVSGLHTVEAVWLVAPTDTASLAPGVYNFSVTLD